MIWSMFYTSHQARNIPTAAQGAHPYFTFTGVSNAGKTPSKVGILPLHIMFFLTRGTKYTVSCQKSPGCRLGSKRLRLSPQYCSASTACRGHAEPLLLQLQQPMKLISLSQWRKPCQALALTWQPP